MGYPIAQPELDSTCEQWRPHSCCTPEAVELMIDQQLEGLSSPSLKCWPLHAARACAITCDPDAATWQRVGNTPLLCQSFCLRYYDSCLMTGADGSYGNFPNASAWCALYGGHTNCLHVPEPSPSIPPSPPPSPSPPPIPPASPPIPPTPWEYPTPTAVYVAGGAAGVLCFIGLLLQVRYAFERKWAAAERRREEEADAAAEQDEPGMVPKDGIDGFDGIEPGPDGALGSARGGGSTARGGGSTARSCGSMTNRGGSTNRSIGGSTARGTTYSPTTARGVTPRGALMEPDFVIAARAQTARDQRIRPLPEGMHDPMPLPPAQPLPARGFPPNGTPSPVYGMGAGGGGGGGGGFVGGFPGCGGFPPGTPSPLYGFNPGTHRGFDPAATHRSFCGAGVPSPGGLPPGFGLNLPPGVSLPGSAPMDWNCSLPPGSLPPGSLPGSPLPGGTAGYGAGIHGMAAPGVPMPAGMPVMPPTSQMPMQMPMQMPGMPPYYGMPGCNGMPTVAGVSLPPQAGVADEDEGMWPSPDAAAAKAAASSAVAAVASAPSSPSTDSDSDDMWPEPGDAPLSGRVGGSGGAVHSEDALDVKQCI